MTPAARVAAAIEVLDAISQGLAAEQALTRWARQSRFAGSKDRAAVRDHVFDVLRIKQSAAALGGGATGRGLMIGLMRSQNIDLDTIFTGEGYAPAALSPDEQPAADHSAPPEASWNLPNWLRPEFERSLADQALQTAQALQGRAPVTLRVNARKASRTEAAKSLAAEGIITRDNPRADHALTVTEGARRIRASRAFADGLVELQDAASQAVVEGLPAAQTCLDYCAGGGGKALALAAQPQRQVFAHDVDTTRMKDLPERADRAEVEIKALSSAGVTQQAPFDLVLCDAPCSGSGAWRRSPGGKWALTPDRLEELCHLQQDILAQAGTLVGPGGWLIYATCSVLRRENEDQVEAFLAANRGWEATLQRRFDVSPDGDGFFTAHLTQV